MLSNMLSVIKYMPICPPTPVAVNATPATN